MDKPEKTEKTSTRPRESTMVEDAGTTATGKGAAKRDSFFSSGLGSFDCRHSLIILYYMAHHARFFILHEITNGITREHIIKELQAKL